MDHNNKHLLPGFQFPTAFAVPAALANAGANAGLLSALTQMASLPTAHLLPTPINPTELAQWAAAQQTNSQAWLDQQKLAAMFPGLYLSSVADVKQIATLAQQSAISLQPQVVNVNGTSTSAIFPSLITKLPTPKLISPPKVEPESPIAVEPLSNASSSHLSSSTPHEIDVGTTIYTPQPAAFDLTTKTTSPIAPKSEPAFLCEASTSGSGILSVTLPTTSDAMANHVMSNAELDKIDPVALVGSMFEKRHFPREVQRSQSASIMSTTPISVVAAPPPSAPPTKRCAQQNDEEIDEHDAVTQEIFNNFPNETDDGGLFGVFGDSAIDGGLSPIQFTPPDSPTGFTVKAEQSSKPKNPAQSTAQPQQPMPTKTANTTPSRPIVASVPITHSTSTVAQKASTYDPFKSTSNKSTRKIFTTAKSAHSKTTKVPIYKQKRMGIYNTDNAVEKSTADTAGDAYSFEDEEENSLAKITAKDRVDQEVKEKLLRMAGVHGEKNKNIYVPGVGFAVPQEQPQQDLWRNVVLKKRPVENRPAVPSANLLPASAHAEACQVAARLAEPEIVTLAESLRRRKKARYSCHFIKTEAINLADMSSFKEEGADRYYNEYINAVEATPKLPKLVIKLPRKSIEDEVVEKKKKKKKRKREEDDSDWEGERKSKKHKHKRKKERKESGYEIRFVDRDAFEGSLQTIKDEPVVKEEPVAQIPEHPMNRKKRLAQQWQEEETSKAIAHQIQNGLPIYNGVEGVKSVTRKPFTDFNGEAIKQRLSKFSQADGNVTKGSFVVNKSELFREDCALWKVDNPNMLQKFPPRVDPTTKNVTYKSSSTYSGWCEQISSGYYKVSVKFLKQSRSESIVEPEVPLSDLFPAMTSELTDHNGIMNAEDEGKPDPNEHLNFLRDQRRMSLYILNKEIVDHALTLEHLQVLKEKNDWNFLKALTDVDKLNTECMSKLRTHTNMREEFEDIIKDYSKMVVTDTKKEISGFICLTCQACKFDKKPVEKIIQLLGRQGYDRETLQYANKIRTKPREEGEEEYEPLISAELYFCDTCATAAQNLHRCYHMMFDLLRYSEDKLEQLGTINSEYKPETIVEIAKKSRNWQNRIFTEIIEMWKKVELMAPNVHSISTT